MFQAKKIFSETSAVFIHANIGLTNLKNDIQYYKTLKTLEAMINIVLLGFISTPPKKNACDTEN